MTWREKYAESERIELSDTFAGISAERRSVLDGFCHIPETEAEQAADTAEWEKWFERESEGMDAEAADTLWHKAFTSAMDAEPPGIPWAHAGSLGGAARQHALSELEEKYVQWRTGMLVWRKREEDADARVQGENGVRELKQTVDRQNVQAALISLAMASSLRTALTMAVAHSGIAGAEKCLLQLTDEELFLFVLLTSYRGNKATRKPLSLRVVCQALGLAEHPHPQTVARKRRALEKKYPNLKDVIDAFRAFNSKGERRDKRREVSSEGVNVAEENTRCLEDFSAEDETEDV